MARIVILSSQVVGGLIGGSIARRVLEQAGHEVLLLPTVVLAHYPGHPRNPGVRAGTTVDGASLQGMVEALGKAGFLEACEAVMIGYLAANEQLDAVQDLIKRAKAPLFMAPAFGDDHCGFFVEQRIAEGLAPMMGQAAYSSMNRWEWDWFADQGADLPPQALITSWSRTEAKITNRIIDHGAVSSVDVLKRTTDWLVHGLGDLNAALLLRELLAGSGFAEAAQSAVKQAQTRLDPNQIELRL